MKYTKKTKRIIETPPTVSFKEEDLVTGKGPENDGLYLVWGATGEGPCIVEVLNNKAYQGAAHNNNRYSVLSPTVKPAGWSKGWRWCEIKKGFN